jgi:hypothetical protein
LQYLLTRKGATNVWEQPLSGGEARQRTDFTSGCIFGFCWSRDGKQLLIGKGSDTRDVVLSSNFRQRFPGDCSAVTSAREAGFAGLRTCRPD